jgi:hypothetical protein
MSEARTDLESLVTYEMASKLFRYEPESGDLFILTGERRGRPARAKSSSGYVKVRIGDLFRKRSFYAHRIIWLLVHREWPPFLIDHIDGNRSNNALSNLRMATPQQNMANMRVCRRNTTGIKGVSPGYGGQYEAQIYYNYEQIHLGTFPTKELAGEAYAKAAQELFGEFAKID